MRVAGRTQPVVCVGCSAAETIFKDVRRTFPRLAMFATDDGVGALWRVLRAYALHDAHVGYCQVPLQRCKKWRIVALGVSAGGSLTRPLRDTRRFPSTRWYSVPGATRTTLGFEICPSFKGHFLSRRAKP